MAIRTLGSGLVLTQLLLAQVCGGGAFVAVPAAGRLTGTNGISSSSSSSSSSSRSSGSGSSGSPRGQVLFRSRVRRRGEERRDGGGGGLLRSMPSSTRLGVLGFWKNNEADDGKGADEGGDGGVFDDAPQAKRVFVCTNKWCKEKGSGAALGAFIGLSPESEVLVQGVNCLGMCNKGPNVRIRKADNSWWEFNRIGSVESVYTILNDFLDLTVDTRAAECLKYNFQGNEKLAKNELEEAIALYDKALATGWPDQEGVLLVMRASAYLQRAYAHRRSLSKVLARLPKDVDPETAFLSIFQLVGLRYPHMVAVLLDKLAGYYSENDTLYQSTRFRYGLYEFARLRACSDAIRATELLPKYSKCWLRAGDALAEMGKNSDAIVYFKVALNLDPTLADKLGPTLERLQGIGRQEEEQGEGEGEEEQQEEEEREEVGGWGSSDSGAGRQEEEMLMEEAMGMEKGQVQ